MIIIAVFIRFYYLPYSFISVLNYLPIGGIGLALFASSLRVERMPKTITYITTATFGIYLCHVIFLEAFEFIEPKIWKGGLFYNLSTKLFVVFLIFIFSLLFTLLLKRIPIAKQLFLGEKN